MQIEIINRCFYEGEIREPGRVYEFSEPSGANLIAGGYGKDVTPTEPVAADLAPTPEEGATPVDGIDQEATNDTSGTGPDVPVEPPAVADPLVCPEGCSGGKPFRSAGALASHRTSKAH